MEVSVWTEDDSLQWLEQWRLAQRRPALSWLELSSRRWSCLERSWLEWPWRGRGWSNSGWSGRGASDQSWHTSVWIGRLYREPQPEDIRWIASEVLGFAGPNEAVRYSIASWSPSLALGLSVHLSTSERAARRQAMLVAKGKQIRCRCEHSTGAGHVNTACAQKLCVQCRCVSYARGTSTRICIVDVFLLRLIARTSVTDDWGTSSYAPINPRYTCAVLKVF